MKRNIFMMAAVALLAMACAKEQQPASENSGDSDKVILYASVEDTKAVVDYENPDENKQASVAFEVGDKMSVWFQTNAEVADEGTLVEFTYEGNNADGSAMFTAAPESIPAEFVAAKAAYPAASLSAKGTFSLVRNYTYDPDSMPIYVRCESVVKKDDGSFSAHLVHNASIIKFTLHDIPAYAAGFVVEMRTYETNKEGQYIDQDKNPVDVQNAAVKQIIRINTLFPYKTGYTADPTDHSNDITLYSAAAHGSFLTRVYLIDNEKDKDGNYIEIEGSEKKFKQSWNDVSKNDFIIMPTIDFKKAELRKDFVKVCGVKWAKGNLQYKETERQADFQSGWRIAPSQWHNFKYDNASVDCPTRYDYTNSAEEFEHFNFGGIGRYARFNTGNMKPSMAMDISGKVYSTIDGTVELSEEDRFDYNSESASFWGDIAFWASMGEYRMPTNAEMKKLHNVSDKLLGWYVTPDGKKIWGVLFRTPNPKRSTNSKPEMQFTDADMESGLFLPNAGRRANNGSASVIAVTTQGAYRTGAYINPKTVSDVLRYYASYYQISFEVKNGVVTSATAKLYDGTLGTMADALDSTAGFAIRPVLAY